MSYTNKYLPGIELQTPQEVAAYIAAHPGDERARWWKVVPAPGNVLGLTTDDIPEGIANLYYNPSRVSKEIADAVASLEIPEASDDLPQPLGTAAAGVAAEYSRGDHVHGMPDASDVGAEPYAGVPAQTSFWRSTAAGVRAWVQLVAADITDLATVLAGYLTKANPNFTGSLLQDGDQRITPSGGGRFTDLSLAALAAGSDLPIVSDEAGVLRNKTAGEFRTIIAAAPVAHNHFSKLDVSASAPLGSIDASAIKVTTTDVILTLSGGVDGQGWDIINPTTATGIAIPSGATLWKSIGFEVGPKTISLGGGRPIRITRIDANTWTMLGSQ